MKLSNKKGFLSLAFIPLMIFLFSCAKMHVKRRPSRMQKEAGYASWYGPGFHGRRTANGERYDQMKMTAAHKKLPFGTKVRVTNLENEEAVVVKINDRGPHIRGRVIDLSKAAAKKLGFLAKGVTRVVIEVVEEGEMCEGGIRCIN